MRWTYVQRTISGISMLFQPLEDAISIRDKLLPAIIGREVSDIERQMLDLGVLVFKTLSSLQIESIQHQS